MDVPGIGETNYTFSPADFLDAEEFRPTEAVFDIIGNGSTTPYTDGVNGLLQQHMTELKGKIAANITLPGGWKKRLRDFLSQQNDEILSFLTIPLGTHPTLGKGDYILRKYGTIKYSNDSSLRDIILDTSGIDIIGEINAQLLSLRKDNALEDYIKGVKFIFEEYRSAGEEALKHESTLKGKLDILDKIQGKLSGIIDLDPLETYCPLMEAAETYIGNLYEKYSIETEYKGFIAAYRRFIALRDIVSMTRTLESSENEPSCTICLNESVSYALVPCGHTYCTTCIKKQFSACFLCRGVIRERVKLFFG